MNPTNTISLSTLVGDGFLTAVDLGDVHPDKHPSLIRFCLNGRTIEAVEDPQDGWRSSMEYVRISDTLCRPETYFPIVKVIGKMVDTDEIEFTHADTGKVIVQFGTDDSDSWYPYWTAVFHKENL